MHGAHDFFVGVVGHFLDPLQEDRSPPKCAENQDTASAVLRRPQPPGLPNGHLDPVLLAEVGEVRDVGHSENSVPEGHLYYVADEKSEPGNDPDGKNLLVLTPRKDLRQRMTVILGIRGVTPSPENTMGQMKIVISSWDNMTYEEATDVCVTAFERWESLDSADKKSLLCRAMALASDDVVLPDGSLQTGAFPFNGDILLDIYEKYPFTTYEHLAKVLSVSKDTIRRRVLASAENRDLESLFQETTSSRTLSRTTTSAGMQHGKSGGCRDPATRHK